MLVALLGIFLFAFQQEWLIIRFPQIGTSSTHNLKHKKTVESHFYHDGRWHVEKQDVLWSNNTSDNLFYALTNWLSTLEFEEVSNKKIMIQTVVLSPSGHDAYISFDRNPFQEEWSVYQKWMWVEGLLKTIRKNNLPIQHIYLLVDHQPLIDRHLYFAHAWPICGFLLINENELQ